MSKSLNLFLGAGAGTAIVLGAAYFGANAAVDYPETTIAYVKSEGASASSTADMSTVSGSAKYQLGRAALPEEIAAWNLDIMPDGSNLPVGSGDVWTGDEIFADQCASCHGDFAEGRGNWPKLAGGRGTLADKDPLKTVGSYWPYLSTTFDYIRRSMPFGNAQSLSDDEVYAITAYILYSNDLVDEDFVLSNDTFMGVDMPNADGFVVDNRDTAEAHFWTEPCMTGCKADVTITMKATVLDVTPDEGTDTAPVEPPRAEAVPEAETAATEIPATETGAAEASAATAAQGGIDMTLAAEGEAVFKKCKACHQVGEGAKNRTGPVLNGVVGARIAHLDDFKYSKDMAALGDEGKTWTKDDLSAFLEKPKAYLAKTKMSFAGLRKADDRRAVIEYLKTFD